MDGGCCPSVDIEADDGCCPLGGSNIDWTRKDNIFRMTGGCTPVNTRPSDHGADVPEKHSSYKSVMKKFSWRWCRAD